MYECVAWMYTSIDIWKQFFDFYEISLCIHVIFPFPATLAAHRIVLRFAVCQATPRMSAGTSPKSDFDELHRGFTKKRVNQTCLLMGCCDTPKNISNQCLIFVGLLSVDSKETFGMQTWHWKSVVFYIYTYMYKDHFHWLKIGHLAGFSSAGFPAFLVPVKLRGSVCSILQLHGKQLWIHVNLGFWMELY